MPHDAHMSIELQDGEEVIFYAVAVLCPGRTEARMIQKVSVSESVRSQPWWRAKMLRALADTIELEAALSGEG